MISEFSRRKIDNLLLRGPTPFTPAVFAAASDLRIISKNRVGVDSIDLASATAHGVALKLHFFGVRVNWSAYTEAIAMIDIATLTPNERLELIERLCDSLLPTPEAVPFPDAHREELDRRLDTFD